MDTFSAGASMRVGWETFKRRPWFLIGASILFIIVVCVVSVALTWIGRGNVPLALAMAVIRFLFEMLAVAGLLAFSLKAHDDVSTVSLMDFWHPQDYWKFVGSMIMQVLLVIAGLILLIVPGIVISVAVKLSPFFVVDKHEGAIESIFSSVGSTKNRKWAYFQFMVLSAAVVFAGFFVIGVGVFVALPVVLVASANAYRTLSRTV